MHPPLSLVASNRLVWSQIRVRNPTCTLPGSRTELLIAELSKDHDYPLHRSRFFGTYRCILTWLVQSLFPRVLPWYIQVCVWLISRFYAQHSTVFCFLVLRIYPYSTCCLRIVLHTHTCHPDNMSVSLCPFHAWRIWCCFAVHIFFVTEILSGNIYFLLAACEIGKRVVTFCRKQ